MKKKLITLILLTLVTLSITAQQNPKLAEAEWAAAEQAYAAGRYEDALRHLDKTQEYVGYWLYTVSHLRILCYDKDIINYWDDLAQEVRRYVDYADKNSNSNDFDNNRYLEVNAIRQKMVARTDYMSGRTDYEEGRKLYDAGYYAQAFVKLQVAAENGSEGAMETLGDMYYYGRGVIQDYVRAAEYYMKSADKGYTDAMFDLGVLYYTGRGVTGDYTKAVEWFRKAVDNGFDRGDAMYFLGYMYANGYGVTQDRNEAIKWMRLAADKGYTDAKEWLAENAR